MSAIFIQATAEDGATAEANANAQAGEITGSMGGSFSVLRVGVKEVNGQFIALYMAIPQDEEAIESVAEAQESHPVAEEDEGGDEEGLSEYYAMSDDEMQGQIDSFHDMLDEAMHANDAVLEEAQLIQSERSATESQNEIDARERAELHDEVEHDFDVASHEGEDLLPPELKPDRENDIRTASRETGETVMPPDLKSDQDEDDRPVPMEPSEDGKIHAHLDAGQIEATANEEIIGPDVQLETPDGEKPHPNPTAAPSSAPAAAPAPSGGEAAGEGPSAPAPSGGGN